MTGGGDDGSENEDGQEINMTVEHGDNASADSDGRVNGVAGMHGNAKGSKFKSESTPLRLEEWCMA